MDWRGQATGRARFGLAMALFAVALAADYLVVAPVFLGRPREPWRMAIVHAATWLANGGVLLGVGGLLHLVGLALGSRRLDRAGVWILWSQALTGFWSITLKHLVGRPRPRLLHGEGLWSPIGPTWRASYESFPSGHAMGAFAVATLLAAVAPRLAWLWYALAAAVSLGRVIGTSHYLSDVLVGGALGCLIGGYVAQRWRAETADAVA